MWWNGSFVCHVFNDKIGVIKGSILFVTFVQILKKIKLSIALFLSFLSSFVYAQDIQGKLFSLKMNSIDGSIVSLNELKNNKASVIIFLSPDCPLCQNYSLT